MIGALPGVLADPTVTAALIAGFFLLMSSVLGILIPHLFKQKKVMAAVHDQVQNSHRTNLRDDIDRIGRRVDLVVDLVLEGQGQVREDLAVERRERIAGDARHSNTPTDSRSSTWR